MSPRQGIAGCREFVVPLVMLLIAGLAAQHGALGQMLKPSGEGFIGAASSGEYDEDFETGNLSKWPWSTSAGTTLNWRAATSTVHGGTYSAVCGSVADNGSSFLQVTLTRAAGTISYYRKVSSRAGDELRFYIDGVQQGISLSGDVPWAEQSFAVSAGQHTYRWVYAKNAIGTTLPDRAYLDDINFPPPLTYSTSGTVTSEGLGLAGVTVTATGGASATTDADGRYTINNLAAGIYTVTPSKADYVFLPLSVSVTVGPDATGADFAATSAPTPAILSGPTVSEITRTSAVVSWDTNVAGTSLLGFDPVSRASYDLYFNVATGADGATSHAVTLAGLETDTVYYLRTKTEDEHGRSIVSEEVSFRTLAVQTPTLAYTGDASGTTAVGSTVTLAATLTQGGVGLSGKAVGIVCENFATTVTTGADGVATVQVSAARLGNGPHMVSCRFTGDANYPAVAATGLLTLAGVPGSTILRGTGYFYKNGDRSKRCTFSFRFNVDLVAGWLIFNEAGIRKWISVNVVKTITLDGSQATIVCGPQNQYTLVVNTDTEAINMTEGTYSASTSRANGQIVLEEETAQ